MAQKTVWLPEIGLLTLSKRRSSRNLRLSVSADGRIRVGMPYWMPYSRGISFALNRRQWLLKHQAKNRPAMIKNGDRIGKAYQVEYRQLPSHANTTARLAPGKIIIRTNRHIFDEIVQSKARAAAERALKKEAESLLPVRLNDLAVRHGYSYKSIKIKKLTSRWGSCSSQKDITLNFFLMQLPWQLIDYVLVHELIHTKHLNHSPAFWQAFETAYPNAKQVRKQIKDYRPVVSGFSQIVA